MDKQLETVQPPSQGPRLDNIAEDVQHMIAAELHNSSPSSLLAMSQSSKTLRGAASPLVYRDVVLRRRRDDSGISGEYEDILELFRDEGEYSIVRHVRNLVVKDELPTADLMLILNAISELGVLRKLTWETTAHMPPSVLDTLHKTWPDLELSVRVPDRNRAAKVDHRKVDENLLSSPLLRNLSYNIIYQRYRGNLSDAAYEWTKISQAIATGGSLRMLTIEARDGVESTEQPERILQLDEPRNSHLPALEEFTLNGAFWNRWDSTHSKLFARSVDVSKLRTLNFACDMSKEFLQAFTGRLPGLKTLRIGSITDSIILMDFIKSIQGLESLDIDGRVATLNRVWPAILHQRNTLTSLCVRGNVEIEYLQVVARSFPALKSLGWSLRYKEKSAHFKLMSRMNLETLELFLDLSSRAEDYCDAFDRLRARDYDTPPLNIERSRASAVKIMREMSAGKGQRLQRLTLHLNYTIYDQRGDPSNIHANLQVRRNEQAGAKEEFEFRGKLRWAFYDAIEEELELEWPVAR